MVTIIVKNNNVEQALRVLKRKSLKNGLIKELRERQYYSKPSEKKREKNKEKKKLLYKISKKNEEMLGITIVKGRKVKRI